MSINSIVLRSMIAHIQYTQLVHCLFDLLVMDDLQTTEAAARKIYRRENADTLTARYTKTLWFWWVIVDSFVWCKSSCLEVYEGGWPGR